MTTIEEGVLESIAGLLGQKTSAGRGEQRARRRAPYDTIQLLAPCDGARLPNRQAFRKVCCRDLSRRGVSFFLSAPATFREAILALGHGPCLTYVRIRVKHCRPNAGARRGYVVGCEFLEKVTMPWE